MAWPTTRFWTLLEDLRAQVPANVNGQTKSRWLNVSSYSTATTCIKNLPRLSFQNFHEIQNWISLLKSGRFTCRHFPANHGPKKSKPIRTTSRRPERATRIKRFKTSCGPSSTPKNSCLTIKPTVYLNTKRSPVVNRMVFFVLIPPLLTDQQLSINRGICFLE